MRGAAFCYRHARRAAAHHEARIQIAPKSCEETVEL